MIMTKTFPSGATLRRYLVLALAFGIAGCAQVGAIRDKVNERMSGSPRVTVDRTSSSTTDAAGTTSQSLHAIIRDDLQHGRYAEGERALRRYLQAHPDDRTAQSMLHQLTVDPVRELGSRSRSYVVQPGDSYSTLAARYLGDGQRFLLLARYNGATDPSLLRAGQTLRLPLDAPTVATSEPPRPAGSVTGRELPSGDIPVATRGASGEAASVRARRMQRESTALLAQGHKSQAMTRLDEALSLDPRLPPSNTQMTALRQQLLSAYHQRAIVLYRDQKLDPAIALWDHVLAIDPGYEPATVYRARALELKQRLKQY